MTKKYEILTDDFIMLGKSGIKLYRIRAIKDFGNVKTGNIGGFIQCEKNLAQDGLAWVYDNAKVFGNAQVFGNAVVYDNARIHNNTYVYGNAVVKDNAEVCDEAQVCEEAQVCDNAQVCGQAVIFGTIRVNGWKKCTRKFNE